MCSFCVCHPRLMDQVLYSVPEQTILPYLTCVESEILTLGTTVTGLLPNGVCVLEDVAVV